MSSKLLQFAVLFLVTVSATGCTKAKIGVADEQANVPVDQSRKAISPDQGEEAREQAPAVAEPQQRPAAHRPDENSHEAATKPERPWAHNTGPTDVDALTPSASLTITTDGTLIENVDITGRIKIDASNVTIRNFRIDATGTSYGILIEGNHGGIVLEDGEIQNMNSAGILAYSDFTARRLHIHDGGADGLKVQGGNGPTLVEFCFIEKLGRNEGSHADGNQTRGGSNITFRHNNIYMPYPGTPNYPGAPYKSNATFMLQLDISNFVIEHNWLTGGNYTIYCPSGGGVAVRNNIFGNENGGLLAGKAALRFRSGNCDEWSGNRLEKTGKPI